MHFQSNPGSSDCQSVTECENYILKGIFRLSMGFQLCSNHRYNPFRPFQTILRLWPHNLLYRSSLLHITHPYGRQSISVRS